MSQGLTDAVIEMREQDALQITDRLLEGGTDPLTIVESCREAMDVIGRRFSCAEAFIPELIMAGEIMQGITAKVKPHLAAAAESQKLGTVVLCTVKGDIHDIGKDIVGTMLDIGGFEVVDLGVDVKYETVVDRVRGVRPQVVGLSGLLTVAFDSMKGTVAALDEAGLRDGLKIMVGGAPVNDEVRAYAGADGWAKDAVGAVELAKTWAEGA
jgi:methanogenic corrinoid protein MtbC1